MNHTYIYTSPLSITIYAPMVTLILHVSVCDICRVLYTPLSYFNRFVLTTDHFTWFLNFARNLCCGAYTHTAIAVVVCSLLHLLEECSSPAYYFGLGRVTCFGEWNVSGCDMCRGCLSAAGCDPLCLCRCHEKLVSLVQGESHEGDLNATRGHSPPRTAYSHPLPFAKAFLNETR